MLTVHHLGISQSERIPWLCEELEIPYKLVLYDRDPATRYAPANYKALHPFGTAPVVEDGDLVMAESGAIMEYIIAKYGNGRLSVTKDSPNFADYLFWFHFANASFMPAMLVDIMILQLGVTDSGDAKIAAMRQRMGKAFDMVEKRLSKVPYFAGPDFTAADIIMFFPLTTMRQFVPRDLTNSPSLRAYLTRVGNRPAYRRAMEKAEPNKPLNLS